MVLWCGLVLLIREENLRRTEPNVEERSLNGSYVFTNDTYEKINLYKIGETHSGKSIKRIKQQQTKFNQCVYLRRFNY